MQKPGLFGMNGFLVFLLTCHSFAAQAQEQRYMILLDAENKQPFVVRVGDQSYFSSGQGHLVLSRLKDSTYKLGLRFPRKNIEEQIFIVAIHRKDLGFQLTGNDHSVSFVNWQTKDIIRPIFEKDSSRLLEKGIRRDDGFSRLMAAVVNDSAVMYTTYAGNGFGSEPAIANSGPKGKVQNPASEITNPGNVRQSAADQRVTAKNPGSEMQVSTNAHPSALPPAGGQNSQPASLRLQPESVNKDSVLAVKRQEIHFRDSLNYVLKMATRDSLVSVKKQQKFLRDSLNVARKAAIKDSMVLVKKRQAFLKDSLSAARKNGVSGEAILAAKIKQQSKDSLAAANREAMLRDSLLAVNRMNFIKDSMESASAAIERAHHASLTQVKKLREVSLKISRKMVFLDIAKNGRADTITLFVYFEPAGPENKKRTGGEPVAVKKQLPPDSTGVKKIHGSNGGLDSTGLSKGAIKGNTDSSGSNKSVVKKNSIKTDNAPECQAATEADTETLRLAILKANSEKDKIDVAAAAFAMKCFSVNQVRFLASLLVSDKAKYGLMDAAHSHIIDRDHFPELVDMLTDKNFQRKFLVMAEKRS